MKQEEQAKQAASGSSEITNRSTRFEESLQSSCQPAIFLSGTSTTIMKIRPSKPQKSSSSMVNFAPICYHAMKNTVGCHLKNTLLNNCLGKDSQYS